MIKNVYENHERCIIFQYIIFKKLYKQYIVQKIIAINYVYYEGSQLRIRLTTDSDDLMNVILR